MPSRLNSFAYKHLQRPDALEQWAHACVNFRFSERQFRQLEHEEERRTERTLNVVLCEHRLFWTFGVGVGVPNLFVRTVDGHYILPLFLRSRFDCRAAIFPAHVRWVNLGLGLDVNSDLMFGLRLGWAFWMEEVRTSEQLYEIEEQDKTNGTRRLDSKSEKMGWLTAFPFLLACNRWLLFSFLPFG